jgi:hypothetical protein
MQNNLDDMTPGCRLLARRERGAYPHGSATSEQHRQQPKDQVRLSKLFCMGDLRAMEVLANATRFFVSFSFLTPVETGQSARNTLSLSGLRLHPSHGTGYA